MNTVPTNGQRNEAANLDRPPQDPIANGPASASSNAETSAQEIINPIPADASPRIDAKPLVDDHSTFSCETEIRNPPKVGELDQSGAQIKNIYSSTREFVIYEAADQIRCLLPDDFQIAKRLRQRIADLGGLRASIEDWRCDPSLSANEKMRSAREMAWALAQALEDENIPRSDEPKDILTRIDARLRSLVKSHYRKKYCQANLAAFAAIEAILIIVAALVVWILPGNMGVFHRYALYGCFGGL